MGVLVGRIGKVEEGLMQRVRNKLEGMVERFVDSAENLGVAIIDREADIRKNFTVNNLFTELESYGVATCEAGVNFWR